MIYDLRSAESPSADRRTLDIGCGEGRVARDLQACGHAVEGVDASATMIALARTVRNFSVTVAR